MEYALEYKDSDDVSVFWIHASSKARITEAYGTVAKKANILGYEHSTNAGLELVKDWFESEASGKWLMIIDNADDLELLYGPERLADYFPRSDNGSIIMTTRNKQIGVKFANTSTVLLETLDPDQSQELLTSKFSDGIDPEDCKELVRELGGIPLALVQAAAFVHMNSIGIDEYLELYRESPSSQIDLLSEDFEDSIRDREVRNPIAATWSISFEYIERHAPLAGELLKMMCTLDYQAIPVSLLQSDGSRLSVVKALGILQAFCLIHPGNSKGKQKTYDMHRLVHISMRNWLAIRNQLSMWTARTLKILASKYPDLEGFPLEEIDLCAAYLPHTLFMLASDELRSVNEGGIAPAFLQQKMTSQHAEHDTICATCVADLMMNLTISYEIFDNKQECTPWAMKAYSLRKFVYGEQHSETLSALFYLAAALYHTGQQQEAQAFGMRAVELIESGEYPPGLVANGYEIRAFIYLETDMLGEAEKCFKQMLEIRRDCFGPHHEVTLMTTRDLAGLNYRQERNEEAEKLINELIEVRMAISGPNHPKTLDAKSVLANVYSDIGRYGDSLRLQRELSPGFLEIFGHKHSNVLITLFEIARLLLREGKYDEGLELSLEVLERCDKFLGLEDNTTLIVMSDISSAYEERDRWDDAEELRTKVLDCYVRLNVPQNPMVSRRTRDLSCLYEGQERYKKAESLRKQVVDIDTERVGEKSQETILSMCELGINYSYQGLYDKASKYQYDSLQLPLEFPEYKRCSFIRRMLSIAEQWVKTGNISDGEKMARDAMGAARQYLKLTDPATISALTGLADACYANYSFEEAEALYREALALRSRFPKPEVAQNMTGLARVLCRRLYLAEAESVALEAREVISNIQNPKHSIVTSHLSTLAEIYEGQGRYVEAECLYSDILTLLIQRWKPEQSTRTAILDILASLEGLAFLYWQSEKYSKAENILSKSLSIRRKIMDPTHIDTLFTVSYLGSAYNSQERFMEALALLLEYNDLVSKVPPRNDRPFRVAMAYIQYSIAQSYVGLGKYDDAETFAKLALGTSKEIFDERNTFTLRCEALLGPIHKGKGSLAEGKEVGIRMLDAWTELLGEKSLDTIGAMQALAKTQVELGQIDEAKELEERAVNLRERVDFGPASEEEKGIDELVGIVFRRWDEGEDVVTAALERLSIR